jgi:hypothetical protein
VDAARDTGKGCSRGHQRRFSVQGRFPTLACAEAARDTCNGCSGGFSWHARKLLATPATAAREGSGSGVQG